ncbi:hybrid sensor histidine kinase/response regulator transcription factor [Bacteroides sp.]|uniref:hybrid sensor histidine kinase/response regulator transcription factor n=1 Tax=Bacteroides sp. TaxID=29523 RepID=UPI002623199D|nr:hybrid sensor histidine kinase/response regulator transcription factor [Bacteroides sp.]MDD3036913.1 two-component regulator propeller domain-containing protein [Bacteroides sp.]
MVKILFKIYALYLLFAGYTQIVEAQSTPYYYKQLGIKEGLSQSRVQCILNDYRGYLWIGTESGLNCYDRDHLKQYLHQPGDSTTLISNNITFIAEDSICNLWVGTSTGICLYNRENDNFTTFVNDGNPVYVASYLLVEGGILFGGSGAIYKYVYSTKQLEPLYYAQDPALYNPFWEMIRYDEENILLNSRWHGIYSFNLKTREFNKATTFDEKNYTSIYFDSRKRLWLSAYGNGLYCYQNKELLKHFTKANSPLTYDVIHDITERDNQLWVATDGGGINMIDLDDFSFSNIQQTEGDVHSFPANTIYRLYVDPVDNMWAGSIRNGLIGIKNVYARSYEYVPFGNSYGLSNQTINCFFQDSDGIIWVGTDGGGINRFDAVSSTFKHYPFTKYEKVVSIVEYSPDELLFSSFNKGLFIFNKHTGQLRPFILVNQEMNAQTCINGFSVYIQRIAENKILFSAQHIFIYDISTRKFEIVATMGKEYERNSPSIIATVGQKTYFSDLKNICEYNSSEGTFKTLYQGKYEINDVCMDPSGTFWIATAEGVIHYIPLTGKSDFVKTGLFREATSVVADNQGRIWIGTRRHLFVYSSLTQNFVILDEVDGVLPNEYLFNASLLAENGDILIGGTEGMTLINPAIHFEANAVYTIELLDVLLNGLPVSLAEKQNGTVETIEVPWNFSSLQLKVLLNENDVFRKNRFRFHIEGFEQELTRSNSNSLVINYLPIGEYTITASYYTRKGEWGPEQQILHLIVTPPWWKTDWFYVGLSICLCLLVYGILYSFYRKKKIKQRREIMRLKNKMYEEKINFLTNISHELRTPLTLICAPLKRILNQETKEGDVNKLLVSIYKQAHQMKGIIDMVLDVRKLEEGKEMLHILPHSLNEWVCSVGDKFTLEFESKGVKIEYALDENIKDVPFDKNKCEFVLSNFLMNALKFSESGTTTTIITSLSPEKDWVRVSVQDEGMGLILVDTNSLFSNFYQGSHEKGGSGIGLSYAKSLINHHKGRVGASNASGHGAIFYFELPLFTNAYGHLVPTSAEIPGDVLTKETDSIDYTFLQKYSVIVVEDTADLRNYLKETLSNYFARVYVAKDGKDALEIIKQRLPDIIISDVMMPRLNGFELCREVKTNLDISHIPFILLTAYHNPQNMYTGYKTGADIFLPKPFEIDSLLALVNNQLKLREQIRTRYMDDKLLSHKEMSFSNADEAFLLKLNTIIEENMSNPELDVSFMATNMCISRSLLFNKIKAITGMGIIDYVNKMRIDKSVVLLTTTSMNITEISEVVGFSSLRYFSKVFKAIKGEIPSTYRKQDK